MQTLASHMCPERCSNHIGERSNVKDSALLTTRPRKPKGLFISDRKVGNSGRTMTNLRFPITLTLKIAEEEHELDVYI